MDLGLWTRATLWLLAVLSVVAMVLLAVARFTQEALGVFGAWLLLYRLLIRSKWRPQVQALTSFTSGASLAMLAPLLAWPTLFFRVQLLVIVGGFPALMSLRASAMASSACVGTALGAVLWQLGLCTAAPWGHSGLLASSATVFILAFSCTPLGAFIEWVVFPVLSALLLVVSMGPYVGTLSQASLFEASPCPAADASQAAHTALVWLALAACSAGFQFLMLRTGASESGKEQDQLSEFLIPSAGGSIIDKTKASDPEGAGEGQGPIPEKDAGMQRLPVLCAAIFADEGADMSHLSEHEAKLVAICRKDEFERDRVLWGGGLL